MDALVGAEPADAVLTTIGPAEPDTATRETGTTLNVTVWVAVCASRDSIPEPRARIPASAAIRRVIRIVCSP